MRTLNILFRLSGIALAASLAACGGSGSDTPGGVNTKPVTPTGDQPVSTTMTKWSGVIDMPVVPVAAAALPNGKVLAWSAFSPTNYGDENAYGYTYSAIFDPATQTSQQRVVSETNHDMFCPGTSMLPDGRLLVNGGSSSQKTSIYDPFANTWTTGALMNVPRGYQGNTTLADGSVLTLGGSWSGPQEDKVGEVWTQANGWRKLSNVSAVPFTGPDPEGVYRGDNHLWLFPYKGDRVFHAGPTADMHWITTAGNGSVTNAGKRGDDAYSMNGNAVMYDIGKILKTGGAPAYDKADATANAYTINLDTMQVKKLAPMNYARTLHNSVVLPNGQVIITGGQTYAALFSDDRSVMMAEMWDPKTEAFTTLSAMQVPRNYHSVSLLLPDGRVLVGGSGLCGDCTTNHANVQILTPPYLLYADGSAAKRPAITDAPSSIGYGASFTLKTDSAIDSVVLMRLGVATHSLNNDQRRVPLQYTAIDDRNYTVRIPSDPGIAPPGYYMLFVMGKNGAPSVSRMMRVN